MRHIAFITGAGRGLGFALSAGLLAQNWTVFAGQCMEEAAARAIPFFAGSREDEDRLVLVDDLGQEWPW